MDNPPSTIEDKILTIRGHKVMIDVDLAALYGVSTKRLNEQVKRNRARFPKDFAFRLNHEEKTQVVANCDHLAKLKFSAALPMVFTEHGALMAASVLNTERAVEVSLYVVRAFVRLKQAIASHKDLVHRIDQLEAMMDAKFKVVFDALRQLMTPPELPKRPIGFITHEDKSKKGSAKRRPEP